MHEILSNQRFFLKSLRVVDSFDLLSEVVDVQYPISHNLHCSIYIQSSDFKVANILLYIEGNIVELMLTIATLLFGILLIVNQV
jgi:hypothetical protein